MEIRLATTPSWMTWETKDLPEDDDGYDYSYSEEDYQDYQDYQDDQPSPPKATKSYVTSTPVSKVSKFLAHRKILFERCFFKKYLI